MSAGQNSLYFFKSVEPLAEHRLLIRTVENEEIMFDFTPRLCKTRFADLKNDSLFLSAATDGRSIIFSTLGFMPLIISAGEFIELQQSAAAKPACGAERGA